MAGKVTIIYDAIEKSITKLDSTSTEATNTNAKIDDIISDLSSLGSNHDNCFALTIASLEEYSSFIKKICGELDATKSLASTAVSSLKEAEQNGTTNLDSLRTSLVLLGMAETSVNALDFKNLNSYSTMDEYEKSDNKADISRYQEYYNNSGAVLTDIINSAIVDRMLNKNSDGSYSVMTTEQMKQYLEDITKAKIYDKIRSGIDEPGGPYGGGGGSSGGGSSSSGGGNSSNNQNGQNESPAATPSQQATQAVQTPQEQPTSSNSSSPSAASIPQLSQTPKLSTPTLSSTISPLTKKDTITKKDSSSDDKISTLDTDKIPAATSTISPLYSAVTNVPAASSLIGATNAALPNITTNKESGTSRINSTPVTTKPTVEEINRVVTEKSNNITPKKDDIAKDLGKISEDAIKTPTIEEKPEIIPEDYLNNEDQITILDKAKTNLGGFAAKKTTVEQDNDDNFGKAAIGIALGAGAVAAGVGAKIYMDKKKEETTTEEQNNENNINDESNSSSEISLIDEPLDI